MQNHYAFYFWLIGFSSLFLTSATIALVAFLPKKKSLKKKDLPFDLNRRKKLYPIIDYENFLNEVENKIKKLQEQDLLQNFPNDVGHKSEGLQEQKFLRNPVGKPNNDSHTFEIGDPVVYIHVCMINNWSEVVERLLRLLL
eukprot:COSAG01_NODE_8621_length_2716_cov_1.452254_4_plen_141_part_00